MESRANGSVIRLTGSRKSLSPQEISHDPGGAKRVRWRESRTVQKMPVSFTGDDRAFLSLELTLSVRKDAEGPHRWPFWTRKMP